MRIRFLGTGPAEAIPRAGHDDPLCRDALAGGRSRRLRSSVLIQENGTSILIDAGPDLRAQLSSEEIRGLSAVFLTHRHSDAAGGVAWLPPELAIHEPDRTTTVRAGPLTVTCVPVLHTTDGRFPTRGFAVNGRFGYVSDCRAIPPRSRRRLTGLDILAFDAAAYLGCRNPTHFSVEQTIDMAMKLRPRRLLLTQTGHTYPPHAIAMRAVRRYAKQCGCPFPVGIAYDGLVLKL